MKSSFYRAMKYLDTLGFKVTVICSEYFIMPYTNEELNLREVDLSRMAELRAIMDLKPKSCSDTKGVVKTAELYGFLA
jgi:hypothetical protein